MGLEYPKLKFVSKASYPSTVHNEKSGSLSALYCPQQLVFSLVFSSKGWRKHILTWEAFQTSDYPGIPLLCLLQCISAFLVLGGPDWNTVLQLQPHKCFRGEGEGEIPPIIFWLHICSTGCKGTHLSIVHEALPVGLFSAVLLSSQSLPSLSC